jgi:hypothetical protein
VAAKKTKSNGNGARLVDPEELLTEEDFEFEDFLDELGPEISTVSIFRVARDGSREHVDKVSLSELIADVYGWLRENCGTGKYQLYFRGADRRYRGAKTVSVGERKPANGAQLAGAGNGHSTSHQEWMEKQFALQQQFITGLLASLKAPDLGNLLSGIAQLAPKPLAQPDPAAMLTAVALVFDKLRGPQKDEDWLARAKTIIELAKDLQPDSAGGDTVWSVVKDVGKEVVHRLGPGAPGTNGNALPATTTTRTTVMPTNAERAAPVQVVVERPADVALATDVVSPVISPADSAPAPTNGASAVTVANVNLPQNAADWLRVGLGYLKEKARLFKEPDIYVDWLFDNLEEPQCKAIIGSIREGATMENLLQFDPEISQNEGLKNWFQRVYDGVHSELFPQMDSTGARGHENHVVDHARSRAAG